MPAQLVILVFQLLLKLLPILYQFRFIKDEATLKEYRRRFEAAVRSADDSALDSAKLRQQHKGNEDDLKAKHDKVWGNPNQTKAIITISPAQPVLNEPFVVTVTGVSEAPEIVVDGIYGFGKASQNGGEYERPLALNTGGERSISAKVQGQIVASVVIHI
jgi:hypothetical protein